MNDIIVIGASGHAKVVIDALDCIKKTEDSFEEIYLLDDDIKLIGQNVLGHKVVGRVAECVKFKNARFVIAIGNNAIRKRLAETYKLKYMSVIHPNSIVADSAVIGEGTVVMAGAVINCDVSIGKHVIINTGSSVDHDDCIADYVHLSPGVHLGGNVLIEDLTWIGVGASIKNNVKIGRNITVGVGGVVIKDLAEAGTYVGVPVRRVF